MKLYDFDGMFDKKITDFIEKNAGKYSESQLEDIIPKLYKQFGDVYIKSVGNTPNGFYSAMTDAELVSALRAHLKQNVPVSAFLCDAIEGRDAVSLLIPLLDGSADEREYAVNLIGSDDRAIAKYMQMLLNEEDADFKDRLADCIKEKADLVIKDAVANYEKGAEREYMLEIMSRTVIPDEKIFKILLNEFRSDIDNIPLHASYLASYGDARALEYLLDKIDEEGISFIEYKELLMAIEALGGTYKKQRDFSSDRYYQLINRHTVSDTDIFGGLNNK